MSFVINSRAVFHYSNLVSEGIVLRAMNFLRLSNSKKELKIGFESIRKSENSKEIILRN